MNPTNKKCRNCFFGFPLDGGEKCECHVNRPSMRGGFPVVRACDYCGYWTDERTLSRPFLFLPTDYGRGMVPAVPIGEADGDGETRTLYALEGLRRPDSDTVAARADPGKTRRKERRAQ